MKIMKTPINSLLNSVEIVLSHNRNDSAETQKTRRKNLRLILTEIDQAELIRSNFRLTDVHGLQQKHIKRLVDYWLGKQISQRTIKNRLAYLRWLSKKIDKRNLVPPNSVLGIGENSPKAELFTKKERTIYVGNLPKLANEDELIMKFSEFGEVKFAKIGNCEFYGKQGVFALVTYKYAYSAATQMQPKIYLTSDSVAITH
jgi:hypothetical protein